MNGKFFRVITEKENIPGGYIQGRFDLWAVKNPDYVPEEREVAP